MSKHLSLPLLMLLSPFHANVSFLYPLKKAENQRFFDVFRGYKNGTLKRKGLTCREIWDEQGVETLLLRESI